MDGATIMGLVIYIAGFFALLLIFLLVFGSIGLWIFLGIFCISCIIVYKVDKEESKPDNYYFTDEDFMHCKIGEWVSRK